MSTMTTSNATSRRRFLKGGLAGTAAAATLAAPNVVTAQAKTFSWKMTNAYGPGSPMTVTGPGSPTEFIKMVDRMSGGRLKIQHFAAGELIPALEGFDAVSKGTVEMNYANAYFWSGKTFAAQFFTACPFGLNYQGINAWLYNGGGMQLWEEVYKPFDLVPIPCGNTGVQMTGWFRKPIETVDDFKGLKMRIPGLAGKVYASLGVDVKLLPAGEIFPALERGVIDAAEAERARTEIARRLLATDRDGPARLTDAPRGLSRGAAVVAVIALVAGAFGLYRMMGSPGYADQPRAARIAMSDAMRATRPSQAEAEAQVAAIVEANRITPPPEIQTAVDNLRAALAANPDDLSGWQVLTDYETRTGNLAAAAAAMAQVVRLKGDTVTTEDLLGLADRMVFAAQGYVSPETETVLDRIATQDPENLGLLYYVGLLYAQTDRADLAFELWRRVIEEGGDSLHARLAREGIVDVAWLSGRTYTPPDLPGPTAEDVAAAADMAPEDREAMIRGMVAQLSDRLATQGGTAEDWARLISSLGVLGDIEQASLIWAEAQTVFANQPEALALIAEAASAAGLSE